MKWLTSAWVFVPVMATGLVIMALPGLVDGHRLSVAMLLGFAIAWMLSAVISSHYFHRAIDREDRAYKGWAEQEELALDLTHLLSESLDHLSTWDRETADEIADRTNTVIRLRFQNFSERNHP